MKNTKRFYVMNPTAEPLDFMWQPEAPVFGGASDDECFKCLTKRGTILPNKKPEPRGEGIGCACGSCETLGVYHTYTIYNTYILSIDYR